MKVAKLLIVIKIGFLTAFCMSSIALAQGGETFGFQGKMSGEFRSNITRQPGLLREEDIRLSLFYHADKQWQIPGDGKIVLNYDLQHYRYGEFSDFTRYDQTLRGQLRQSLGHKFKLTISDELRFRLHPSTTAFNYTRNIVDFSLTRKVGSHDDFVLGYQNWLKTYPNNPSLSRYVSHRAFIKVRHDFSHRFNLGAKLEYQNHKGNLYVGSTAPDQALNLSGNRLVFALNLDKVYSRRFVSTLGYKFERDIADDFDLEQTGPKFDDEDTEEFLAEDSDFGYDKHQVSWSLILKANHRISFLAFYLFYTKGFDYWLITTGGPHRQDKVLLLSHKVRIRLSKKMGVDVRHSFEANRTNLNLYKYTIHAISVGVIFTR